jgi:hypothetical protein
MFRSTIVNTFPQLDGDLMGLNLYGTSSEGPVWKLEVAIKQAGGLLSVP